MVNQKHRITPFLWFDNQAREAAEFYTSVFQRSKMGNFTRYTKEGQEFHGMAEGAEMTIDFDLEDENFTALNGGPSFEFNPSISLFVAAKEGEIDELWKNLEKGGKVIKPLDKYDWSDRYGWLQDKFGLSWQLMLDKGNSMEQKICPLLSFTGKARGKAEEAVNFYTSIFKDSRIEGILRYEEEEGFTNGNVKHAQFKLRGQCFMAMDGAVEEDFPFNETISFAIHCETQEQIDYYWDHLSEGGDEKSQQCGWLKDKFGISWQVVPTILQKLLDSGNQQKTEKVTRALLQMKKLDIQKLKKAFDA